MTVVDPARAEYDEGPLLIKVSVVMPILSVIVVGLRIWARRIGRKALGLDDWLIILAQAFAFGIPIAAVLSALHGVGKHIEVAQAADPNNLQWVMGILFVGELAYIALIAIIKLSILQLYITTFPTPYMRKAAIVNCGILLLWTGGCMIVTIFQCTPIEAAWNKPLLGTGATCINQGAYFIGVAVPHVSSASALRRHLNRPTNTNQTATDVLILALPLVELKKLQMPKWKKFAIAGIFLLGSFIIVFSIIRLTTLIAMYEAGDSADVTMLLLPVELWTVTEVSVAIICACLPTLGPLIAKFGPAVRILATKKDMYSTTTGSGASPQSSMNRTNGHHRLPSIPNDNAEREGHDQCPSFLPDGYACDMHVSASRGGKRAKGTSQLEIDEIPLRAIHVQQDMTWREEGRGT